MVQDRCFCPYCGERFSATSPWPRKCDSCGGTSYLNPLPVAVVMVPMDGGLVVMRRNTEPRKGTLTLPGGYIDHGESWQGGARRELLEETGIDIVERAISLYDVRNGLDNTLVIFGLAEKQPLELLRPFSSDETQEVTLIRGPIELGFPLHTQVVAKYFAGQDS